MLINQPTNLLDRIIALERGQEAIRKLAGLTSAIISRGGLSLLNDSFVKMVDADGFERLYIGHTSGFEDFDQPVFMLRDATGKLRFGLYDPAPVSDGYQPVVWIYDHLNHVVLTSDINGGMAEPWIPVPMYAKAWPSTFLDSTNTDLTLPVSACNGGIVWEGRIGKSSHPRLQIDMICGRVTGVSGNPTYTLKIDGNTLDSWSQTGYFGAVRGPYDITPYIAQQNKIVTLSVSATGTGTDRIAAQMLATWMRQT